MAGANTAWTLLLAASLVRPTAGTVTSDLYGDPLPPGAIARLGTVRFRHDGEAGCLAFSPDGKLLAAHTLSGTAYLPSGWIHVWDAATGKELRRLRSVGDRVETGTVTAFTLDSTMLAAPMDNRDIGLWEIATGRLVRTFPAPPGRQGPQSGIDPHVVRFSADGKFLAVGARGGAIVFDAATGRKLPQFRQEMGLLAFAPDSKTLALLVQPPRREATEIQIRDLGTGGLLRRWEGPKDFTCDLAFSPDGKLLALAGTGQTFLYESATGTPRGRLQSNGGQVKALAFTPDGRTLLTGSEDTGKVHFWDLATGEERRQLDSRLGLLRSLALSPDGKTVAAGTDRSTIRLWDMAGGKELFGEFQGHEGQVNSLAYAPDGRLLASGEESGEVWLWDPARGRPVRRLRGPGALGVTFSPDGRRLTVLSAAGHHVYDPTTGAELLRTSRGETPGFAGVALSADGQTLVSADRKPERRGMTGCLNVWDPSTGRLQRSVFLEAISPDRLALSPDGTTAAVAGDTRQGRIRLVDLHRGRETLALFGHATGVSCLAFSPDGQLLASGCPNRVLRLWDLLSGSELFVLGGAPLKQGLTAVAFSPGGRLVAAAAGSDSICLWDVATGKDVQLHAGPGSAVNTLAFSPDGSQLASGLQNSTVLLWKVAALPPPGEGTRLDGRQLESLWGDLAGGDARRAHAAVWGLAGVPRQALAFFAGRLQSAPGADGGRVRGLVRDLDSDRFAVRERAGRELERLGEVAEGPMRQALEDPKVSLEARRRLELLLERLVGPVRDPEMLRALRALQVLECIGTAEAKRHLEALANGAAAARLTREAKAALRRLAR
jgi:WD40 repeat protein